MFFRHHRPIWRHMPVHYCSKHWHDYVSSHRPSSATNSYYAPSQRSRSLRRSCRSHHAPESLSRSFTSFQSRSLSRVTTRSRPRSTSLSRRSWSPSGRSVAGSLDVSLDSDVEDLVKKSQALNKTLASPISLVTPLRESFLAPPFLPYDLPCIFQCRHCGRSQPLFLPKKGIPVANGLNLNGKVKNGLKDIQLRSKSLEKIAVTPQVSPIIPRESSKAFDQISRYPITFINPDGKVSEWPRGSIPAGSHVYIVTPPSNGTTGAKSASGIPPDLQLIMDKYAPKQEEDLTIPSRDQLVADAMNRLEEKKKKKLKDDYLQSLKNKREKSPDRNSKSIKSSPDGFFKSTKPKSKDPLSDKSKSSGLKKPTAGLDEDAIVADKYNAGLQSGMSGPFSLNTSGTSDEWGKPTPQKLRDLELSAMVAAKWWEKTKRRLDQEKKAQSKKPTISRTNSAKESPAKKSNLDSLLSFPAPKKKSKDLLSDDEVVPEYSNKNKLHSAFNDLPLFEKPKAGKKDTLATPLSVQIPGKTENPTSVLKKPTRKKDGGLVPTTPRDITPRFDHKLDKDKDRVVSKSPPRKPLSLGTSSSKSSGASAPKVRSRSKSPAPPSLRGPSDDDDLFLSQDFTQPVLNSQPPGNNPHMKKDWDDLDSSDLLAPVPASYGRRWNSPNGTLDNQHPQPSSSFPETKTGPGGLVNYGNVNMYILQGDENTRQNAMGQADRMGNNVYNRGHQNPPATTRTLALMSPGSRSTSSTSQTPVTPRKFEVSAFHR